MKKTNNRHFRVVLKSLKKLSKENINELDSRVLLQIQEIIKHLELGIAAKDNSINMNGVVLGLLGIFDRIAQGIPAIAALLKMLG